MTSPFYLDRFECRNFFSLRKLELSDLGGCRELYFLGENGDGKTLILQAIMLALNWEAISREPKTLTATAWDLALANSKVECRVFDQEDRETGIKRSDIGKNPTILTHQTGEEDFTVTAFGYGVNRNRSGERHDRLGVMTLFNPEQVLRSPSTWLSKLYTYELERKVKPQPEQAAGAPSLSLVKGMLKELFRNDMEIEVNAEGVSYIERGTRLELSQLSEGYRSVMTWVLDLLQGLAHDQPQVSDLRDYSGIVLVDEISLHLHPRWERVLVQQLRHWFPKIQFIMTTHSPITVMGASEDAVFYRVFKQGGITSISEPFKMAEMRTMLANALITSPLFGLADARMRALGDKASPSTAPTYLHELVYERIHERLVKKKRPYHSKEALQQMIDEALDEAVGS